MKNIKKGSVSMKVHPDFRDILLEYIINERINNNLETRKKPATYYQITKLICNFFEANPKLKKPLCEVIINGK